MGKVKIKNICEDRCIGFSFKPLLKPNQTTVIDEELVTEADRRLIDKGLASVDHWDGVIDKAPVRVPESPERKEDPKPVQEIITKNTNNQNADKDEAIEVVTPTDIAKNPDEEMPADGTSDGENNDDENTVHQTPLENEKKTYTREELGTMTREELREIGKPMGVRGRGIEKLVDDILSAQGNAEA